MRTNRRFALLTLEWTCIGQRSFERSELRRHVLLIYEPCRISGKTKFSFDAEENGKRNVWNELKTIKQPRLKRLESWGEENMSKNTQIRQEWRYDYKEIHQVTSHQDAIEIHQSQLNNDKYQTYTIETTRSLSGSLYITKEKNKPQTYQFSLGPREAKASFIYIVSFIVYLVSCTIGNLLIKLKSLAKGATKINFHFRLKELTMGPSFPLTSLTFCWNRILEFPWPNRKFPEFCPVQKENCFSWRLSDRGNCAVI